jgi:hypothetical protein
MTTLTSVVTSNIHLLSLQQSSKFFVVAVVWMLLYHFLEVYLADSLYNFEI